MMKIQNVLIILLFLSLGTARAETMTFSQVWSSVKLNSPAQESAGFEVQAAEAAQTRASRHWLPKIYLDARTYSTNDPGNSFFGLLEQRKVNAADFNPDALNQPGSQTFTRGALGLDLPLYEGGMKSAQEKMFQHSANAKKLTATQIQVEQYAQTGLLYGFLISVKKQKSKVLSLTKEISRLMKNYELGQKSNPVGYSGLLGMKSLANRLGGLVDHYDAIERASYSGLKEMGVAVSDWSPEKIDIQDFVEKNFSKVENSKSQSSHKIAAFNENVVAMKQASEMEKAKFVPRIGAFAESYIFNGDRDSSDGYSAGFYLQWSLFDPANYGSFKEAQLKTKAAQSYSQAMVQEENAQKSSLQESQRALVQILERLQDSDRLLAEQTRVSTTLFRNGSITALQFVEILNRRADLIAQQSETEQNFLKSASAQITKTSFEVPAILKEGEAK